MQAFAEAFPGFTSELENEKQEDMSDDAMYAVVRMLNAQFGGKEEI